MNIFNTATSNVRHNVQVAGIPHSLPPSSSPPYVAAVDYQSLSWWLTGRAADDRGMWRWTDCPANKWPSDQAYTEWNQMTLL